MRSRYLLNMRWIIPLCIGALVLVNVERGCACSPKVIAYRASMKSDLRVLAMAESDYHDTHGSFSADLAALGYFPSRGVSVELLRANELGWLARARHEQLTITCTMGAGERAPIGPLVDLYQGGAMVCDPLGGDPYRTVATVRLAAVSWAIVVVAALVGLGLVRRRGAPRRHVIALLGLVVLHPLWIALLTLAQKTHSPDCGRFNNLIAICVVAVAGILLFVQWRTGRSQRLVV